ncbi:MAG: purine-nucleoside phosphorylase [Planctomycetota bacterium]
MSFAAECEERIAALAAALAARGAGECALAIVLGSGLGDFAAGLDGAEEIPVHGLPGWPASRVPGHGGRLVRGRSSGVPVLVQEGRVHLYEGWSPYAATRPVRAFARAGIRGLLLTNAAGAVGADLRPPVLMRIVDHLNLQGATPLFPAEAAARSPYDPALGAVLDRAAAEEGVPLPRGVYAGLLGPSYETPAEVAMLARLGADAVGMSTVAEAAAGAAAGMRVAALSCIANVPVSPALPPLSHAEVLSASRAVAAGLARLLRRALPEIAGVLEEG